MQMQLQPCFLDLTYCTVLVRTALFWFVVLLYQVRLLYSCCTLLYNKGHGVLSAVFC